MSDDSYKADKVSGMSTKLVMLMLALGALAGWLNFTIANNQKIMNYVVSESFLQYARTQRISSLMVQYRITVEAQTLAELKQEAGDAFAKQDELAAYITPTMPPSPIEESGKLKANGLHAIHMLVQNLFSFLSNPGDNDYAESVIKLSRGDVPKYFLNEIGYYTAAKQKELDMFTYILYGVLGVMGLIMLFEAFILLHPAVRYIVKLLDHIDHMAATDSLTGFYNRSMLFKVVATVISGAKRHKHELAVLAADIDNFKSVNEAHGRAAGDAAIRAVANKFKEILRTSDVVGRVAGQEFGIFLPNTDEYRASLVAEKLRAAVEDMPFAVKDKTVFLRVSIGAAEMQAHHKNPDDILRAAEAALARAKEMGRNKVVTASSMKAQDNATVAGAAAQPQGDGAGEPKANQA